MRQNNDRDNRKQALVLYFHSVHFCIFIILEYWLQLIEERLAVDYFEESATRFVRRDAKLFAESVSGRQFLGGKSERELVSEPSPLSFLLF